MREDFSLPRRDVCFRDTEKEEGGSACVRTNEFKERLWNDDSQDAMEAAWHSGGAVEAEIRSRRQF